MKRIRMIIVGMLACFQLSAQTYDELISHAMDAVEKDSLYQAEELFKKALKLEPANMRNALLFSNLGTIQRRMGKNKEALESYSLALNRTPYSITMLLNRASLYLEMDYKDKAYVDYCNVIDLDEKNALLKIFDEECLGKSVDTDKETIPVSIAKGFARYDSEKDTNFIDVFNRADDAMYENKRKIKGLK